MHTLDISPATLAYLNQITTLHTDGGVFHIHGWQGHTAHIDNPLHRHSFFEVCYVVSGEARYREGHNEYVLQSGDYFCSRPLRFHQIYEGRSLYLLWFSFELDTSRSTPQAVELVKRLAECEHDFIREAQSLPSVLTWHALLVQASRATGLSAILQPLASGFLSAMMSDFLQPAQSDQKPATPVPVHNPLRQLHGAKTYIEDNLSVPLRLRDVANYLLISERTLSRLFHEYDDTTFIKYLQSARLSKAEHLLRHSDYSIKRIVVESGFDSVAYFTRAFTQTYGIPPGQYRARVHQT